MAKNKKHIEDKFYTKKNIVIDLLKEIDIDSFEVIIEPSAGNGSFSNQINHKNVIALDINPEDENIIKIDWFKYIPNFSCENCLVIGNPPFGVQCNLAIKFFEKCCELNVKTIAFILPKSFKKHTIQNRIPLSYHLVNEIDLPDDSYTLNGKDYSVPTVFQVWEKNDSLREKVILKTKSKYLSFVKKDLEHDFAFRRVGVNAGTIYDSSINKSIESHYFIKCDINIKNIIEGLKWDHNNTAGPRSIGKGEIIQIVENEIENKKVK